VTVEFASAWAEVPKRENMIELFFQNVVHQRYVLAIIAVISSCPISQTLKVERSENLQQTLDLYSMVEPTIACKM